MIESLAPLLEVNHSTQPAFDFFSKVYHRPVNLASITAFVACASGQQDAGLLAQWLAESLASMRTLDGDGSLSNCYFVSLNLSLVLFLSSLCLCLSVSFSIPGAETWEGLGDGPQILKWGTAHALVPPIFREVVLSDVCERMNRVKKWSY